MKLNNTIMVNAMKRILFPLLILLFCFVNTSKADNLAPEKIEGARTINTVTAKLLFDKGYHFIDVRGLDDFKIGHIPGAYHLSIKSDFAEQNLSAIVKKTQPVVIYCNGILCMGSSIAIKKAIDWGWLNIFYYREGIRDWKQQGYSVRSINP
ncbi:rhodanese-like domain-containing protein [Nitrosomonas sp.]|uniref:rhodanese-like domain-containing protein n=1 Tax=Nitrosomonas sp. TaxID=42353 RepID=UPI00374D17E1